jgi:hypothetical protein
MYVIKHLNINPSASIVVNHFYPKTGLEKVLSTCSLNLRTGPSFKHFPPTSCFVHRVDRKPLAFRDGTPVPSLCSFSLEQELRPQKPNPKKNLVYEALCRS